MEEDEENDYGDEEAVSLLFHILRDHIPCARLQECCASKVAVTLIPLYSNPKREGKGPLDEEHELNAEVQLP